MLIEERSEEVAEVEAVGFAVIGVEGGGAGEVAEEMLFESGSEGVGHVAMTGGAHEVQRSAESGRVADCSVSKVQIISSIGVSEAQYIGGSSVSELRAIANNGVVYVRSAADNGVSEAPDATGGESSFERLLIGDVDKQVVVEKRCGYA